MKKGQGGGEYLICVRLLFSWRPLFDLCNTEVCTRTVDHFKAKTWCLHLGLARQRHAAKCEHLVSSKAVFVSYKRHYVKKKGKMHQHFLVIC